MTANCPTGCGAPSDGLLCANCVLKLEQALGDVRSLVDDLYTSMAKQARVPAGSGGKVKPRPLTADEEEGSSALKHERSPINWGAVEARDVLTNVLETWARDLTNDTWRPVHGRPSAVQAAWLLLGEMTEIRRHPAVGELVEEVTDAVEQARRFIDRPADRVYVGRCRSVGADEYGQTVECGADLYARPGATVVRCRVCMADTDVAEQQAWLMAEARPMLVSVRQAAQWMGSFYGSDVSEATIRGLIHRKKLGYVQGKLIRLGDLLDVLTDRKAAA